MCMRAHVRLEKKQRRALPLGGGASVGGWASGENWEHGRLDSREMRKKKGKVGGDKHLVELSPRATGTGQSIRSISQRHGSVFLKNARIGHIAMAKIWQSSKK